MINRAAAALSHHCPRADIQRDGVRVALQNGSLRETSSSSGMKDICYIAAFPKSGITYLNFMLFKLLCLIARRTFG